MGASKKEALKMLVLKYGHIAKRFPAKRFLIKNIWKDEEWARENYDPCLTDYGKYYEQDRNCSGNLNKELTANEDS